MIRFALKGLLGRKLRTALTAIAIVLGVAMVSGTYVLTDSIDKAFNAIFTEVYRGTDATITGEVRLRPRATAPGRRSRRSTSRCSPRCKALPDVADAIGGVASENAQLIKDGKAIVVRRRSEPRLLGRPVETAVQLPDARGGRLAGRERGRDRHVHGREEAPAGRRRRSASRSKGPSRRSRSPGSSSSAASTDRRRHARRLRPADRAAALRQGRQARPDPRRGQGRASRRSSSSAQIQKILPPGTRCGPATRRRPRTPQDTDEFISFLQTSCSPSG